MREMIVEFFTNFGRYIILLHVLSAIIWVGGMVALRFAVGPALQEIVDPKVRLSRVLESMRRFFLLVIPFIVLLIATSVLMNVGMSFKNGDPTLYILIHTKEAIWTFMTLNFIFIYLKRRNAERAFVSGDTMAAANALMLIANYLIPLNIIMGITAVYFGVTLRGI